VRALLGSLRSLLFGETWSLPLGVAGALCAALLLRSALPQGLWGHAGGFLIAALVAAALTLSLRLGR